MKKNSYTGQNKKQAIAGITILAFAITFVVISSLSTTVNAQYNYDYVNVTSRVNITNSMPEILGIFIDDGAASLTLNAGTSRIITCNATIRDYNGFADIDNVDAKLYYYLNSSDQNDDQNEHYTNSTCTQAENDGEFIANYTCTLPVSYFANNGTWACNITVNDTYGFKDSENETTLIDPLYALNVTDTIDYGNLSVLDTSENITATVTNFGNMDINISVLGYGESEGDGVGLVCNYGTNISIENQRFSGDVAALWAAKTPLSILNQDLAVTVPQQVDDATPVTQGTYWQLYVPPNPFGVCTGTVKFTATTP